MNLGTLPVDTFKLGATQVDKVMLGATEVWASGPPPPSGCDFFEDGTGVLFSSFEGLQDNCSDVDWVVDGNVSFVEGAAVGSIGIASGENRLNAKVFHDLTFTSDNYSISFWVYAATQTNLNSALVVCAEDSMTFSLQYSTAYGDWLCSVGSGSSAMNALMPTMMENDWNYFTASVDVVGGTFEVFLNNNLVSTKSMPCVLPSSLILFGDAETSYNECTNVIIDQMRVIGRNITSEEHAALMAEDLTEKWA